MSPERLNRTADALDDADRSRFFSLAPALLCVMGTDGYVQDVNPACAQVLGPPSADLRGRSFLELIHPDDQASTAAALDALLSGSDRLELENRCLTKDGSYRWFEWEGVVSPDRGCIYAVALESSERRRTARLHSAQFAVSRILADSADFGEAAPNILRVICESFEWELGAMWAVDRSANLLRCTHTWHVEGVDVSQFKEVSGVMTFPPGIGLPGRVWASGEPAWIPDLDQDRNFPRVPIARSSGLKSAFAFPISCGTEVRGVAEFFSRSSRSPDDEVIRVTASLGGHIGQFLARKQVEEEREKLIRDLQEAVANVKTLTGLLPICATCKNVRGADGEWYRIEDYISARSSAHFTHGICTQCARALHPDWDTA